MTGVDRIVYDAVKAAAREGRVCPTNAQLFALLDCKSPGTPSAAISRLEAQGLIIVQRFNSARIVTFPGPQGLTTADPFATIKRDGRDIAHVGRGPAPRHVATARPDPCSFCGIRPDVARCTCRPRATGITVLRGRLPATLHERGIAA